MANRVIKDSIKRSAQIDSLTWFEEVVFYRLILTADDYGCIDGRSVLLKNDLFPLKENVTRKAIEDAISKLVSVGLLCRYTVSGTPYLLFPTWEKHQRIRNKRPKYPMPENLTDICRSNDGQTSEKSRLESESESESNPNPKEDAPARHRHGEYKNVLLTDEELEKLKTEFPSDWQARIDNLSAYMRGSGRTYKDHLAVIRTWARKDAERGQSRPARTNPALDYTQRTYTEDELSKILYDPAQDFKA